MTSSDIVTAARACIGTPFRAQGRLPGVGLDCIGLAAVAVRAGGVHVDAPADYDLSGESAMRLAEALDAHGFRWIAPSMQAAGDIILFQPGRRQQHLGISTGAGFVHAHLGLRKVVETPLPAPWPVVGVWRVEREG